MHMLASALVHTVACVYVSSRSLKGRYSSTISRIIVHTISTTHETILQASIVEQQRPGAIQQELQVITKGIINRTINTSAKGNFT